MRQGSASGALTASTRVLMYAVFAVGLIPYYLLPFWAGVFDDALGLSPPEIGFLLSADMAAGTIAALAARYWIRRFEWRPILTSSIILTCMANLACVSATEFSLLFTMRAVAGFFAGTMMAVVYATFSSVAKPDREFSIALAFQVAIGALAIYSPPAMNVIFGPGGTFMFVAGFSLLPFAFARACPNRNPCVENDIAVMQDRLRMPVIVGLAAIGMFFISLTAIWVIMERLGSAGGLDQETVATILSLGLFFSFAGAILPSWTINWLGRPVQVTGGYLVLGIAIVAVALDSSLWIYAAAICVYNFFFSFIIPLQTAWIAETDRSGRNAVLVPVVQGIGVTIGPLVAGATISDDSYITVIVASLVILLSSFVCVQIADRLFRR